MIEPTRPLQWLLAGALAIAAAGCASGPAPRDHFYRLEVARPAALASPRLRGTVEVERFRVESIFQGRNLVYRDARRPEEIERFAYQQWTDPPSLMLRDQLVAYLRAAGAAEVVVTPAVRVDSDYLVSGRIVRLETLFGGEAPQVVVELELTLTRNRGPELLLLKTYREQRNADDETIAASVRAYEQAITAIFERFVADLPRS